jgi:hypothetical protein
LGNFRAIHRPEAPSFGAFWCLARVQAKGEGQLRELNRIESGFGLGSGRVEESEVARRRAGRCPGGQAEMREDRVITVGSRMAAMIVKGPPQFGQCSRAISKTRLSSLAQLMRPGWEGGGVSA